MNGQELNWAVQVDPQKKYLVRYTINPQRPYEGRVYRKALVLGKDMTENQIKEHVMGVSL